MNALIKIRCFLGLVRVEEGDFCALQTLELLVISFLEALYVLEVFKTKKITKNKLRLFPKKPYALAPCELAQHPCRFESRVLSDYFKIMLMHSVKFSLINLILRFDIPACCIFN